MRSGTWLSRFVLCCWDNFFYDDFPLRVF